MLHGMLLDRHLFQPQVDGLCDRFRVMAPDLRSRWGDPASVNIDQLAKDVVDLIEQLDITSAVLVGMSLGGYVAQHVSLMRPERIRGLVLVGADVATGPDPDGERAFESQKDLHHIDPEFARAQAEAHFARSTLEGKPGLVQEWSRKFATRTGAETWAETLCWSRLHDISAALHNLDKPMLAIWGAEDACVPLERAQATVRAWPGARLVIVPNAGHAVNVEESHTVNTELAAFVERVHSSI